MASPKFSLESEFWRLAYTYCYGATAMNKQELIDLKDRALNDEDIGKSVRGKVIGIIDELMAKKFRLSKPTPAHRTEPETVEQTAEPKPAKRSHKKRQNGSVPPDVSPGDADRKPAQRVRRKVSSPSHRQSRAGRDEPARLDQDS